jgi:hypothetical protein
MTCKTAKEEDQPARANLLVAPPLVSRLDACLSCKAGLCVFFSPVLVLVLVLVLLAAACCCLLLLDLDRLVDLSTAR